MCSREQEQRQKKTADEGADQAQERVRNADLPPVGPVIPEFAGLVGRRRFGHLGELFVSVANGYY